jgi:hypothetical protein
MANKTNTHKLLQELGAVTISLQRPTPLRLNLPARLPRRMPGAPPKRKRRIRIHSPGPDIPVPVPICFL